MQRPRHSGLKRSETACDQGDDIVEITIVVKARNPRLIWRACMSGWRKGQDGGNQTEAHKSVQDDSLSRRCHCHPTAEEGSGRNARAFTSNYWLLSTTCSRREGPIGQRRIIHARAASDLTTESPDPPGATATAGLSGRASWRSSG